MGYNEQEREVNLPTLTDQARNDYRRNIVLQTTMPARW